MRKKQQSFTLLEVMISIALFSLLMGATLTALLVAQRSETMQIRKSILAVEAKKAQNIIQRDIESSQFRSIDVIQKEVTLEGLGSDSVKTWSHYDDFTEAEFKTAFGNHFKRCNNTLAGKPNCGWNFENQKSDNAPTSGGYRYPHVYSAIQYSYASNGLTPSASDITLSLTGKVWAGVENATKCPIDTDADLVYTKIPIKAVKMLTSRDRVGFRRSFLAGSRFGQTDWQGFVFYVNVKTPGSTNGKLLRYVIYKDDLDLQPRSVADLGIDTVWESYETYNGTQTMHINGNDIPVFPATRPGNDPVNFSPFGVSEILNAPATFGSIVYNNALPGNGIFTSTGSPGIPSLLDLFDFNQNGDLECFPRQLQIADFDPLGINPPAPETPLTFGREATQEIFQVRIGPSATPGEIPSGHPYLEWSKTKKNLIGELRREFYIRINLRTHEIFWQHKFTRGISPDPDRTPPIRWERYRSFIRNPEVVANNIVQWEMMTYRGTQEFWSTAFDEFPRDPGNPVPYYGRNIPVNTEIFTESVVDPLLTPACNADVLRVAMDRYVRLVLVFDRPYFEGGELKHEEFVFSTGFSAR